jgi:hypothetical protein
MKEIQTAPAPQPDQPDWCTCIYCSEMPKGKKVCFKENSERPHISFYFNGKYMFKH